MDKIIVNSENIDEIKLKIDKLLKEYRFKHDELELAEEEWDVGEIQEDLANYTKEINILKKKVHEFEEQQKLEE